MARLKIDYGIDLGTTNSAIARMENGQSKIQKIEVTDDTMPSCIYFNKKKSVVVGAQAYSSMKSDKRRATKSLRTNNTNTFVEFKRTMGSDTKYVSSNMGCDYSSEELSAEVLKTLKSFVQDEDVKSVVITVPAKFTVTQKDATMRAAKLAGFEHTELLQEPIAASMAYGLSAAKKDGYWMVFDFGGGTFDAALLKVEDGIMQVFDTEGDNYLGGKNLDYAIVDEIIIPYLQENFSIEDILSDNDKKQVLRDAMKTYAEEAKNQLSFKPKEDIISNLGDLGEDDEGTELELDLSITQEQLKTVFTPIFQKAVDICKELLERNNMKGSQLSSLILVGGPTHSPILRQMLKEQISQNVDTSIDPMTAVACGAALYASTIDNEAKQELQTGTIALDVSYEATSVETVEFATVKLDKSKCTGAVPAKLFVELTRGDKAWSSGKVEINEIGDVIECQLLEGKANAFTITAYNEKGTALPCFPNEISIIQGSKIGSAILPYDISIGIWDEDKDAEVLTSIKGLEKNKSIPATGVRNGLKTTNDLRAGISDDRCIIRIYQGDHGSDGIKAMYYDCVYEATITGDDVPQLVPKDSDVDITIKVDRSEGMSLNVFFPSIGHTQEILFDKNSVQKEPTDKLLSTGIRNAKRDLSNLDNVGDLQQSLERVEEEFKNGDQRKQVLQHLREVQREIDSKSSEGAWDRMEAELREEFERLEKANNDLGNDKSTKMVEALRKQIDDVIRRQDEKMGKEVLEAIRGLFIQLTLIYQLIGIINHYSDDFSSCSWKNTTRAKQLLNQGLDIINNNPTVDKLHPIVNEVFELLPETERINDSQEPILTKK